MTVVNDLYIKPITSAKRVAELCDILPASAYSLISDIAKRGILSEVTGGKRGRCMPWILTFLCFINILH